MKNVCLYVREDVVRIAEYKAIAGGSNMDARPLRRRRKLFRVSFNYAKKCTNAICHVKGQRIRRRILCKALRFLSLFREQPSGDQGEQRKSETIAIVVSLACENETRNM